MIATIAMTAGSIFLMWIGEQIDAYGIGNGISLLIMAGIIARMPDAGVQLLAPAFKNGIRLGTESGIDRFILLAALFVTVVIWVVAITQGQRRIPIQSAKHVRGRRVMGGQRQSLALAGQSGRRHADHVCLQHPGLPDVLLQAVELPSSRQRIGRTSAPCLLAIERRLQHGPRLHLQHVLISC